MKWNKSHIVLLMNMFVACSEGGSLEDNTLSENIPIELGAYASKYSDTRAGGTIGNNDLAALAQNGGFGVYSYFLKKQEFMINQQVTAVTNTQVIHLMEQNVRKQQKQKMKNQQIKTQQHIIVTNILVIH